MRASAASRRPVDDATTLFGGFSLLFAVALLLHQLWWHGFEVGSPRFAVVLAALWTALRPGSVGRLLTLLGAEVVVLGLEMPAVHSHKLLVLVGGAGVLAFAAGRTLRSRRMPGAGELFTAIAPFLRVQLVIVYVAAAVSKMNSGFFDPATSCAAGLSAGVAWFDPSLLDGTWRLAPAIWGTVAVELALPVLLVVPRTRLFGLLLGGGFHAVLALAGNVPFTALVLAYYVAFLPAGAAGHLRLVTRPAGSRAALPVAAGAWAAAAAAFSGAPDLARALIENGTRVLVVLFVAAAAVVLLRSRDRSGPAPGAFRGLRHPAFTAATAVLILNGLSPYLGFKTESSFAMFSNLQTEAGRWNHAFIPEAIRVLPYQDDLVRIVASNDPALEGRARGGRLLVRYELERYLRMRPGAEATVVRAAGGSETRLTAVGAPAPPSTWLLDRVAKFRDVRPPGRC